MQCVVMHWEYIMNRDHDFSRLFNLVRKGDHHRLYASSVISQSETPWLTVERERERERLEDYDANGNGRLDGS